MQVLNPNSLSITFYGKNLSEIKQNVKEWALDLGVMPSEDQPSLPFDEAPAPAVEQVSEKKAKGLLPKKKIEEKVIDLDEPLEEIKPVTKSAVKTAPKVVATKDDAANALKTLNAKHGLAKCKEVLEIFGALKFSDLKEESFGEFVEACQIETAKVKAA